MWTRTWEVVPWEQAGLNPSKSAAERDPVLCLLMMRIVPRHIARKTFSYCSSVRASSGAPYTTGGPLAVSTGAVSPLYALQAALTRGNLSRAGRRVRNWSRVSAVPWDRRTSMGKTARAPKDGGMPSAPLFVD